MIFHMTLPWIWDNNLALEWKILICNNNFQDAHFHPSLSETNMPFSHEEKKKC